MRIIPVILFMLVSVSLSDTATQTDWSGGGGVPGPVTDWGDTYDVSFQVYHAGDSLQLQWGILDSPTRNAMDNNFDSANSVYAADVDDDGDTDVLGAASSANDITWWENNDTTGTSWTEHTVEGSFFGAYSVYATDVNGDGRVDVLGVARDCDTIAWWNATGYFQTGILESSILDAGTVDSWNLFATSEVEPAGTSVIYQFRSSDDSASMGAWSTGFTTGTSLTGILADSTNFLQYKVQLQTTDPAQTPVLNDVTFTYTTYVAIDDNNGSRITSWGFAPAANPSFNNIAQGVYFCTMHAEDFTATERMVVIK